MNPKLETVLHSIQVLLDNFSNQLSALEKEDMSISGKAIVTLGAVREQARQLELRTVDSVEHPEVLELVKVLNSVKTDAPPTVVNYYDALLTECALKATKLTIPKVFESRHLLKGIFSAKEIASAKPRCTFKPSRKNQG
jgi:hypothetical protein